MNKDFITMKTLLDELRAEQSPRRKVAEEGGNTAANYQQDFVEAHRTKCLCCNISWEDITNKLKMISYDGAIALEVGNTRFEHIAKPDEFLKLAVERAERIGYL